eukprot:403331368
MKSQKSMPPQQQSQSFKAPFRTSSPFKQVTLNKSKNASKDLESYILRNSTESLKGGKKVQTSYNFQEVDQFDQLDSQRNNHASNDRQLNSLSNSPHRDTSNSKVTKISNLRSNKQQNKSVERSQSRDTLKRDQSPANTDRDLGKTSTSKKLQSIVQNQNLRGKYGKVSKENVKPLKTMNQTHERSVSQGARLTDLCPEDKAKIGELVKKLAIESKQKQEYAKKYEQEKLEMSKRLQELEQMSVLYEDERDQMKDKFSQSLQMLQQLKSESQKVERDKLKREEELQKVKDELKRREIEVERQKKELLLEKEEKNKQLSLLIETQNKHNQSVQQDMEHRQTFLSQQLQSQHKQHQSSIIIKQSEMSTSLNDQTVNTLKEISDLKNEINKLTSSLKHLKITPDKSQSKQKPKNQRVLSHDEDSEEHQFDTNNSSQKHQKLIQLQEDSDHDESIEQNWWKQQSQTSKMQESKVKPTIPHLRQNPHKQQQSNSKINARNQASLQTNSIDREDLQEMKIDDLYALQDQLAKNLEITNSLLQSKITNSSKKPLKPSSTLNSFRGNSSIAKSNPQQTSMLKQSSSIKALQIDQDKMAKLMQKAQSELKQYDEEEDGSDSVQSTPRPTKQVPPEPESLSKRDEILSQKMQIFKEIQSRFTNKNESQSKRSIEDDDQEIRTGRFQQSESQSLQSTDQQKARSGSFYKQLIQQQTQILHSQKDGRATDKNQLNQSQALSITNLQSSRANLQPQFIPHSDPMSDEDDDLVYSLNQRSEYNPLQKSSLQQQQQTFLSSQTNPNRLSHQPPSSFKSSLSNPNLLSGFPSSSNILSTQTLHQQNTLNLQNPQAFNSTSTQQQNQQHYDDSLFNIIDEIEYEQKAQESVMLNQSQHSERSVPESTSKKANSYFEKQLNRNQNDSFQNNHHQDQYNNQVVFAMDRNSFNPPNSQQQIRSNIQPYQISESNNNTQQNHHSAGFNQPNLNSSSYKQNPFYLQAKLEEERSHSQMSNQFTPIQNQSFQHQQSIHDLNMNASYSRINNSEFQHPQFQFQPPNPQPMPSTIYNTGSQNQSAFYKNSSNPQQYNANYIQSQSQQVNGYQQSFQNSVHSTPSRSYQDNQQQYIGSAQQQYSNYHNQSQMSGNMDSFRNQQNQYY